MKTATFKLLASFTVRQPQSLLLAVLAFCCFPAQCDNVAQSVVSKLNSIQIIRGIDYQTQKSNGLNKLESGKFIGYSHKLGDKNLLDFSVNTYLYTDDANDSVEWIIGVEHENLVINYYNNQVTNNQYVEVISRYPVNHSLSINGYMSNNNDGHQIRRDYAVAVAYFHTKDLEIAAGYSDRETHAQLTDGNIFVNVVGHF